MNKPLRSLFTWLALAAGIDWLVTRTLVRAAIFMPKPALLQAIYQGITQAGQFAANLASLLALLAILWIAWQSLRQRRSAALGVMCLGLVVTSLLGLFLQSGGWLVMEFQALLISAVLLLVAQVWVPRRTLMQAMITASDGKQSTLSQEGDCFVAKNAPRNDGYILLTALVLLAGSLYQSLPALYTLLALPGPPPASQLVFNAGEMLVLLAVYALWWRRGRGAAWWIWLLASLPALAFAALRMLNPAMTGILAIWSSGLTLYLPWPLYFLGLWLAGVTVLNAIRNDDPSGWALLLLAAGGYAPQLSMHAFLGLVGLWLLVQTDHQKHNSRIIIPA